MRVTMVWVQVSLCVLALLGGARSLPGFAAVDYHAYPKYSFEYGVNDASTGDVKQHSEQREGDVVKGQYSLVEPDGSVRQVEYTADPVNGFNAVVLKSQPSLHPVKPAAAAAPPVAVQKPLPVAVAPVKYLQTTPLHFGQDPLVGLPLAPQPYPHDPYGAYLHPSALHHFGHF